MRRAAAVLLVMALIVTLVPPPAQACIECVALGLASFAVFTQFVAAATWPRVVYTAPPYYPWYGYPVAYAAAPYPVGHYPGYYPGYASYYPAYRPAYAAPAPVYVDEGPACRMVRERFWDGYGWRVRRYEVCD